MNVSAYTIGWILWVVWFLALEGFALASGEPGRTLTAHVRWILLQHPGIFGMLTFFLLVWLAHHFLIETFQ